MLNKMIQSINTKINQLSFKKFIKNELIKYNKLLLIYLLCGATLPTLAAAPEKNTAIESSEAAKVLPIQHWQTTQGVPVYFVQSSVLPMIDVRIVFTAGSAYDGEQWGLANFVGSLLGEGTKQRSADEIAQAFDQVGAQFSVSLNRDFSAISLRSLSQDKYLNSALEVFEDVISAPSFSDQAIERIKQQTAASIKLMQQDPGSIAENNFYQDLYNNQPYGHPVIGDINKVQAFSHSQAEDFYKKYYVYNNAKIILVGDLSRERANSIAENLINKLPKGEIIPSLPIAIPNAQAINTQKEYPAKQTTIVLGQLGIDWQDKNYFPLYVGSYILGGLPLGSLLFEQVRNQRGLAYGASSYFLPLRYKGPFIIELKTRANKTNQAISVVNNTLNEFINKGPSQTQLQMAQNNIINSFPLTMATNRSILSILTEMAYYQLPLDYLDTYREKIKNVTTDQIKQSFHQLIDTKKLVSVTVGVQEKTQLSDAQ